MKVHSAKLVSATEWLDTENQELIENRDLIVAFIARVSNPGNQHNHESAPKLLEFLMREKHVSPFEMAHMCVEIVTTRAISPQILRHKSLSPQEFSMRYSNTNRELGTHYPEYRKKGSTNRQGSVDDQIDERIIKLANSSIDAQYDMYELLIENGAALESARNVLPLCAPTRLYLAGNLRSWFHYLMSREDHHTQKEHRMIASSIASCLKEAYPFMFEMYKTNGYQD